LCITEVVAAKEDGDYKLSNALSYNTKSWSKTNVGSITFIHPREHTFDRDLGERMSRFVDSLAMLWNIPVQPVEYYFADRLELVYKALGLDFYIGEGNHARPGGFADTHNRIVYAGGENEWYPHEFVHIYINPLFPNAHGYFLEGYATLLGGHRGKSLSWHLKRMNQYLHDHPDLNLNDLFSFWHIDFTTDPSKVFGGLLCKMAEEKGGLPAVKKLFSFGSSNDDFYRAIEEMFGVKREGLNDFLRSTIAKYAGK
ncbi:MAG: hypothetical protein HY033_03175, partial [Ignavibacteriae bacterium]|nr:hypothetical protein [Ignavibacteriota bacterium]